MVDKFDEDEGAALVNRSEADIHVSSNKVKKNRSVKADPTLI